MNYPSIRIEGAILSPDILDRLEDAPGQRPADFGIDTTAKVKDEIARAWADAQDYWRIFHRKLDVLRPESPATTETRNQWVVPLLGLLGYQVEYQSRGIELNGKTYAISHRAVNRGNVPIHIVGYREPAGLDRKPEKAALRMSAHGMLQEYLNLKDELYGLVTNGRIIRLLRDTSRLIKLTYLEFDIDRIFIDGLFADFAVLYRLLHASRLPTSQEESAQSLIERYHQDSLDSGARIRAGLANAVEEAIRAFAKGFLDHKDNEPLRQAVVSNRLNAEMYYQHLLRLIYRLLFLMVIEERGLVFPQSAAVAHRSIYDQYYSVQRLRRLSEKRHLADHRHHDQWMALCATFNLFEAGGVGQKLGVAPLAGDLFEREALGPLKDCYLGNDVFLRSLRSLCVYENEATRQTVRVNYAALNVEEFGSVYEGLLEYEPVFHVIGGKVEFSFDKGDKRAATGSHYTPDDLVQPLIKHSLDYLIAEKLQSDDPARGLLDLRVADVACGSGHILLAAARRIGTELAIVRTGEEQPSPTAFRAAIRDVIRECIYGVDLNPLAVELCKVALWLEAHVPGESLNFLDHHIRCGNAIVGVARKEELERGIPNEAFATMPDDDKEVAALFRKKNKTERKATDQVKLDLAPDLQVQVDAIVTRFREFSGLPDNTPERYAAKKRAYDALPEREDAKHVRFAADLPIAQFYLAKTPENKNKLITHGAYQGYRKQHHIPSGQVTGNAFAIAIRKRFFHWFLEFPEIIDQGGFDCILGNPPYLGGQALSGTYGQSFCHYVKWEYTPTGLSDLVVFFVRRIFNLLRPGGMAAFITTNSIKDGDIRKDSLEYLLAQGGQINFAVRGVKWPGQANLVVSLVGLHRGPWRGKYVLDGREVPIISAHFEDQLDVGQPNLLPINADRVYQGTIMLGDGFLISHIDADRLIASDENNKQVIFKTINGDELNNHPTQEPQRSVINFGMMSEEEAEWFVEPFGIVEQCVRPARHEQNDKGGRLYWWRFLRPRMELYSRLNDLQHCFVAARTTKYLSFSATQTNYVFSDALYVFTTDRWDLYTIVQSTLHEVWARKYSGALETRLRYSPSDCFETFPFPKGLWEGADYSLADIGERYHEHRRSLMRSLWLGLTDVYNLVHNPGLTPVLVAKISKMPLDAAEERYSGILALRDLHRELDVAIRNAYGWLDLDLAHDFHEVETLAENDRVRYTISPAARKEVLRRLLALNHERAAAEAEAPVTAKLKRGTKKTLVIGVDDLFVAKGPQVFPWDGRETFVYDVIPQLVSLYPGRELVFYQYAAFYASYPQEMREDFLNDEKLSLVSKVDAVLPHVDSFPKDDKIRPDEIRSHLLDKGVIAIDGWKVRLLDVNRGAIKDGTRRSLLTLALDAADSCCKGLERADPHAVERKSKIDSYDLVEV